MLRILTAILILATPAWADDFLNPAPVTDVTVYPVGASVGRTFTVDLPAGRHRVLIPRVSELGQLPRVALSNGAVLGAMQILPGYLTDPKTILTDRQRSAKTQVDAAREVLQSLQDAVVRGQAVVEGQKQKLNYLRSLSGANLTMTDPSTLRAVSDMVAEQISSAMVAQLDAEAALRATIEARDDAQKALAQAERDFARLSPPEGAVDILAISVDMPSAGPVEVSVETLISEAGWQASYDLNLARGDPARIDMKRRVVLQQYSREAWTDIALTLSTANPFAQVVPSEVFPLLAQIHEKGKAVKYRSQPDTVDFGVMAEVADSRSALAPEQAQAVIDGLSVTYKYPSPVSVGARESVILSLDTFSFEARQYNRAAPRFDQTAFLMAEFTNPTDEPFLPGEASVSRDGVFVGRVAFARVPAGADAEISFGPLEGLQLSYKLLDNDTGESGFLTTSSTRTQEMEFSVENLFDQPETVQTLFALPFAEQEDLSIKVRAVPSPDMTDFEKRRNVAVWSLELAPGEKKTVRVTVKMDWPDGQELIWNP